MYIFWTMSTPSLSVSRDFHKFLCFQACSRQVASTCLARRVDRIVLNHGRAGRVLLAASLAIIVGDIILSPAMPFTFCNIQQYTCQYRCVMRSHETQCRPWLSHNCIKQLRHPLCPEKPTKSYTPPTQKSTPKHKEMQEINLRQPKWPLP